MRVYESPVGRLVLAAREGRLCLCDWEQLKERKFGWRRLLGDIPERLETLENADAAETSLSPADEAVVAKACLELDEYFAGKRQSFDIPLCFIGTPFQNTVWEELLKISYGQITTYTAVAQGIGRPDSVRAVANAIGANPLSIFVPCHRVIGADGSLTGYAGGLEAKRLLLGLENPSIEGRTSPKTLPLQP